MDIYCIGASMGPLQGPGWGPPGGGAPIICIGCIGLCRALGGREREGGGGREEEEEGGREGGGGLWVCCPKSIYRYDPLQPPNYYPFSVCLIMGATYDIS